MKGLLALIKRDVKLQTQAGGSAFFAVLFFVLIASIVPFGIGPDPKALSLIAPGIVWIAALLSVLLTLDRVFQADFDDGSLNQLVTLGPALELIAFSKGLAHFLVTGLPLCVAAPLVGVMLNLPAESFERLIVSVLLGTPALSFIGLIGAGLIVGVRRAGLLVSLLVLPLYVPVLIFGTVAVTGGADSAAALLLLALISAGALVLAPFAAAASVRLYLG